MDIGLVAARFFHITALLMLFGAALFPLYAHRSVLAPGDRKSLRLTGSLVVLFGAVNWFVFTTLAITDRITPDSLLLVMRETGFGHVWAVRLILTAVLVFLAFAPVHRRSAWSELCVLTLLLVSLAGIGHSQIGEPVSLHMISDVLHLLAAGAWIGGLLALGFALAEQDNIKPILTRFSAMGLIAVSVLIASGLVKSWFLVGALSVLWTTAYGNILLLKLALFAGMLVLAGLNRFVLMPKLAHEKTWPILIRSVVAEQSLGFIVLALVAILGTIEPAIDAM
jgi:putative copper resistance protein D